jgi:hypothetical protein
MRRIGRVQRPFIDRIGAEVGADELRAALTTMRHLVDALEVDQQTENG